MVGNPDAKQEVVGFKSHLEQTVYPIFWVCQSYTTLPDGKHE